QDWGRASADALRALPEEGGGRAPEREPCGPAPMPDPLREVGGGKHARRRGPQDSDEGPPLRRRDRPALVADGQEAATEAEKGVDVGQERWVGLDRRAEPACAHVRVAHAVMIAGRREVDVVECE